MTVLIDIKSVNYLPGTLSDKCDAAGLFANV
jgi:hypothetical protein